MAYTATPKRLLQSLLTSASMTPVVTALLLGIFALACALAQEGSTSVAAGEGGPYRTGAELDQMPVLFANAEKDLARVNAKGTPEALKAIG